jgi:hypothetical protein
VTRWKPSPSCLTGPMDRLLASLRLGDMLGAGSVGRPCSGVLRHHFTAAAWSYTTSWPLLYMTSRLYWAEAFGIGVWSSSLLGGLISAVALVPLAPQLANLGFEFGPWNYFSLVLFALTITVSLAGENMLKGLIADRR